MLTISLFIQMSALYSGSDHDAAPDQLSRKRGSEAKELKLATLDQIAGLNLEARPLPSSEKANMGQKRRPSNIKMSLPVRRTSGVDRLSEYKKWLDTVPNNTNMIDYGEDEEVTIETARAVTITRYPASALKIIDIKKRPSSKPADTRPTDIKPVDTKPTDIKSVDTRPVEPDPMELWLRALKETNLIFPKPGLWSTNSKSKDAGLVTDEISAQVVKYGIQENLSSTSASIANPMLNKEQGMGCGNILAQFDASKLMPCGTTGIKDDLLEKNKMSKGLSGKRCNSIADCLQQEAAQKHDPRFVGSGFDADVLPGSEELSEATSWDLCDIEDSPELL